MGTSPGWLRAAGNHLSKGQMKSKAWQILLVTVAIELIWGVIWLDLDYHWTGYSRSASPLTTEQLIERQKAIWDWLELLLIPLVLAAGGLWFSWAERRNDRTCVIHARILGSFNNFQDIYQTG